MPELFKLVKEKFSEKYKENQWTYQLLFDFVFNNNSITHITITDHAWKKKGRNKITKELVLNVLNQELNGRKAIPTDYEGKRKVFIRERVNYLEKKYKMVFWFKDGTTNHLWIRNFHQQD